jgi:hypothetical protein
MTLPDRFWAKVDASGDCWEWTGSHTSRGYGQIWTGARTEVSHRVVWEMLVGPIPDGLQIDHLCRNRSCVNPDHLEPVEPRENYLRGFGPAARHARQTHCGWGHEFTDDNTFWYRGSRLCRACNRDKQRLRKQGKLRGWPEGRVAA